MNNPILAIDEETLKHIVRTVIAELKEARKPKEKPKTFTPEELKARRAKAHRETMDRVERDVLAEVERSAALGIPSTSNSIRDSVKGGIRHKCWALESLVKTGRVAKHEGLRIKKLSNHKGPPSHFYLPPGFDVNRLLG